MPPKDLVRTWVDAFNRGDAAELANLYHADAVNHQITQEPVEGRDAIHQMFAGEFAEADMECIIENLFETANGRYWNGAIRSDCTAAGSFT